MAKSKSEVIKEHAEFKKTEVTWQKPFVAYVSLRQDSKNFQADSDY